MQHPVCLAKDVVHINTQMPSLEGAGSASALSGLAQLAWCLGEVRISKQHNPCRRTAQRTAAKTMLRLPLSIPAYENLGTEAYQHSLWLIPAAEQETNRPRPAQAKFWRWHSRILSRKSGLAFSAFVTESSWKTLGTSVVAFNFGSARRTRPAANACPSHAPTPHSKPNLLICVLATG